MNKSVNILAALALSVGFSASIFSGNALAAEGWNLTNGEWEFFDENDQPVTETWKKSKDFWYYLSSEGRILKDCMISSRNSEYYVDEEGRMVANRWVYIEDEEDQEGWHYFGADGKGYKRSNNRFKKVIDGKSYIFNEEGVLLTGWIDEDGNSVDSEDPFVEGLYFSREDGALLTGEWLSYDEMNDGNSSLQSEIAGRDYSDYGSMWLFFDNSSKKLKSNGEKLKQKNINGSEYGFDENGIMINWWSKVASISYADKSNPTSSTSALYYSGYDGGKLLKNMWFWMYPSENLDETDYNDGEASWWHTNDDGEVYRNRIRNINGRYYAFDGLGRMKTGFVLFDGRSEFVAQYDVDAWGSEAFINGMLYGIEKADFYLFSPDELNDGSMQTGKEIVVDLEDGPHTFGFASNGKAYGNRNKLQKKDKSYYINGLRLEADTDLKYGVVEVEKGDETYYQVVDFNGRVVEGQKKVVKDGDGAYLLIINNKFVAYVGAEEKPRWRTGTEGTGFYYYDKYNKEDHYAEGLIAGPDTEPSVEDLPDEERLNF